MEALSARNCNMVTNIALLSYWLCYMLRQGTICSPLWEIPRDNSWHSRPPTTEGSCWVETTPVMTTPTLGSTDPLLTANGLACNLVCCCA